MTHETDFDFEHPEPVRETAYTAPLADLARLAAPLPAEAVIRLSDALRRRFERDPRARLAAIEQAIRDIRAGVAADLLLQAECIRPWRALYRLVVERQDIDRAELFATALARLKRQLAGEEREVDKPVGRRSVPPERKPTARKAEKPKAKPPTPPAPDCTGDVI
jgi:hypothetical protein